MEVSYLYQNRLSVFLDQKRDADRGRQQAEVIRMAKVLEFVFQFPPVHGVFDTGFGIVYIFGELHENEIEDILAHETLHYVLLRVAGKRASLRLDRVYSEIIPS